MTQTAEAHTDSVIARFSGDRTTYIKEHILLAAIGSVGAVAVLMAMGNPHAWTGVVGAIAAIGVRGFYVASEQLNQDWTLTPSHLTSPTGVQIARKDIQNVRTIFSAAQVITQSGDKYMLKYQKDPKRTAQIIREGRA